MKLGDWLKENFEDIGWKIQDFREGVYFVWLRSEEEQKRMLDRGELLAQEDKFYLEEYVYRKNFEEKKEVLKSSEGRDVKVAGGAGKKRECKIYIFVF